MSFPAETGDAPQGFSSRDKYRNGTSISPQRKAAPPSPDAITARGGNNYTSRREGLEPAKVGFFAGSKRHALTCSGSSSSRRAGSAIHIRHQNSPNWVTPSGVYAKRRSIEKRGIPELKGRRFLTLTLDPALFGDCPITGYLQGKDHMRRFLEAGRIAGLWDRSAWWCWKLEFQKNNWAHWHLIIDRTAKFTKAEMQKISEIWALGRTNCRRISKSKFGYQFKYAFKGVFQDDDPDGSLALPQWFLDHIEMPFNGSKPKTFARVRFWQTSKGFYTSASPKHEKETKPKRTSIRPRTVREIHEERNTSVLVIARDRRGKYIKSTRLRLRVDFNGFARFHCWDTEHGAAATLSFRSFMCAPDTLENKLIEKYETCKLQHLLRENKMTLRQALRLRRERRSLETC